MKYKEALKTLPENSFVVAIACQHDTDIDEVCSIGHNPNVHNFDIFCDHEVEKIEHVAHVKTLSKYNTGEYCVNDYKKGGYVVYIRPADKEAKTLSLKGINFEQ